MLDVILLMLAPVTVPRGTELSAELDELVTHRAVDCCLGE
jgi:hypothetical protein